GREAARAGATVVGEDLGIIPAGMQQQLAASGILGYRLMMFEDSGGMFHPPETYTEAALASFGTHDLPTWKGWRAGADIDTRERIGLTGAEAAAQARAERNARKAALDRAIAAATPPGTLTGSPEAMIGFLGVSRSRLVAVQAEDLFGLETQANLPGTVREYPNWRLRLPVAPADWADDERLTRTAGILCQSGRQRDQDEKIHSDQTD
ncbi:4-alpha-glucanotransferase, partial [Pseudooceanicola sp.]|uniref:4-alpha-glucanotransferase n=1 Tax=Pseudooceanicola sp. TaxID=1914328 RepID=UPI0035127D9A